ncbi:MAG: queuosine precursor transporter [Proteobacteria bacterium]|nr:queuosine precursor transporter [Pseudomonadota bacterium]MBS0218640.1 queuosine precursor transporter [Pseudomonadota bacterium]
MTASPRQAFRYYDMLVAGMVAVLLCSNLIGPAKVSVMDVPGIGPLSFGTGNLFFPIGYIFGDVLTEVYGYARARRAIWAGFGAMIFATVMAWVVVHMPMSPAEPFNQTLQPALEVVFGNTWRIALASMIGYWVGDFVNAFVMARMKVLTGGKHLWTRTIGSTVVGQACDSITFYPIAFLGIWESTTLVKVILFNWTMKVLVEVVLTPVTYAVVGWLKRAEAVDTYDRATRFNPFSLRDEGEVTARES